MKDPLSSIEAVLAPHGFRRVKAGGAGSVCRVILKRQTLNTNRAVAFVDLDTLPHDMAPLLKRVKREVAFRAGFLPLFYGMGIQLVLVISGSVPSVIDAEWWVDKFDNQWSIIQSVFVVRSDAGLVATARTWGQIVTGKYQDAIQAALSHDDGG